MTQIAAGFRTTLNIPIIIPVLIFFFFFFLELHLPMWQHFVLSNYGPFGKLAHTFIRFLFAEFVNWEDYRDISQLWTLDLIQTIA